MTNAADANRRGQLMQPHEHLTKAAQLLYDAERCMEGSSRSSGIQVGLALAHTYIARASATVGATGTAVDPRTNEPPAIEPNEHGGVDTGALLAQFRMLAVEASACTDDSAERHELLARAVWIVKQLDRALGAGAPLPQAWAEMQRTRD